MSGNVHQDDASKLKATVSPAAGFTTEVTQDDATQLKNIMMAQLVPMIYDYIGLTYTGSNLTSVVYKSGGSSGTTVATLTLSYTGSQLDSVTRT